jgi:hypothetical protein
LLLGIGVLAVVGGGCRSTLVGRQCFIAGDGGASTIVSSPSLECPSRTCLRYQGNADLCTAECRKDGDCVQEGEACSGRFVCAVATVAGPFCCRKLCVCEDYIFFDGSVLTAPTPAACNPSEPLNGCCNLEGRRDNPIRYPQCQAVPPR